MDIKEFREGRKVRSLVPLSGVPQGTIGYVIEQYSSEGILIGWDLPEQPFPKDIPVKELTIEKMAAIHPRCPLRDGFDQSELDMLEVL